MGTQLATRMHCIWVVADEGCRGPVQLPELLPDLTRPGMLTLIHHHHLCPTCTLHRPVHQEHLPFHPGLLLRTPQPSISLSPPPGTQGFFPWPVRYLLGRDLARLIPASAAPSPQAGPQLGYRAPAEGGVDQGQEGGGRGGSRGRSVGAEAAAGGGARAGGGRPGPGPRAQPEPAPPPSVTEPA